MYDCTDLSPDHSFANVCSSFLVANHKGQKKIKKEKTQLCAFVVSEIKFICAQLDDSYLLRDTFMKLRFL